LFWRCAAAKQKKKKKINKKSRALELLLIRVLWCVMATRPHWHITPNRSHAPCPNQPEPVFSVV
jgi:hypothetical protein